MSSQGHLFKDMRPITAWRPPTSFPRLDGYTHLGFDFETTGKNPYRDKPIGFSLAVPVTPDPATWKKYYFPFAHKGGGNLDEGACRRFAMNELKGKHLAGLNIKFENHIARGWDLPLEKLGVKLHDVAFAPALLNEHRYSGFSLRSLAEEYLPESERKIVPSTVDEGEFHLAAAGEVAPRAESDAGLALQIYFKTLPLIQAEELDRVLDLEDSLIYCVSEMEWNGARIDRAKCELWGRLAAEKYQSIILWIYSQVKCRVSPDSHPDMIKLFEILGLPFPRNEEGNTSFEEQFLTKIDHPIIKQILLARKIKSLKSKYLDKYLRALDSNNILRFALHQLRGDEFGTVTGRFSSSGGGLGANIQQVPKVDRQIEQNFVPEWIIRELFIPDEGHDWMQADASQIEYRIFGHYSGNQRILNAYNTDPRTDFHQFIADDVRQIKPNFARFHAKTYNFLKIYGGGRDKAAKQLGLDSTEEDRRKSDQLYDAYDERFPEASRLMNKAMKLAERRGYVKTLLGRRRRYPDKKRLHSALNAVIQGTAADINKLKLREVYENRDYIGLGKMRLSVHDEIDADAQRIGGVKDRMEEVLNRQALPLKVPVTWEVELSPTWRGNK